VFVAQIGAELLTDIVDTAAELNPGDSLSPKVLRALAQHLGKMDVRRSAETGAGGSTLLFSHLSARHTAFAMEGDHRIITRLKSSLLLRKETTEFVEGPTQRTLPAQVFDQPLQAVLIDGPHAFPFPQIEYYYLYPNIASGGLLILDDIHIRTIHELYRFLRADEMFDFVQVVEQTAFFRRTTAPVLDPFGDGWWLQSYNRKRMWRYTWREVVTGSMPRPLRALLREGRAVRRKSPIDFDAPRQGTLVDETALVRGRADLPLGSFLCLFARRADLTGWWPQGGPIAVTGNQWEQVCKFGEAADEGHAFEIAAVVADERARRRIQRWFDEGSRRWGPMNLPAPMAGTGVATMRVFRRKRQNG
jgi:hypothetical protein